jgi:hypothetical protein
VLAAVRPVVVLLLAGAEVVLMQHQQMLMGFSH